MTTAFFVAADWLAEHIDDPEIQILDADGTSGQEDRDVGEEYRAGHILAQSFLILKHFPIIPHRYRI